MTGRAGFVSLIGRPNAGKSTLLNRLVGEKLSIVSPRPQTTRNRITGIKNLAGVQIIFVDTPGLYPAAGKLGDFMLKTARRAVEDVDLVCLVVDASAGDGPDGIVLDPLRAYSGPVFCVLNKNRPRAPQEPDAAAHRDVAARAPVRRDRPYLRHGRNILRSPPGADRREAARASAVLPGGRDERPARDVLHRRDDP